MTRTPGNSAALRDREPSDARAWRVPGSGAHQRESQALKRFLEDPARPTGTLKYHELQGFLFAVASAPDLVPPSEWMPIVFGGQHPEYENLPEASAVLTALMAICNTINAVVAAEQPTVEVQTMLRGSHSGGSTILTRMWAEPTN